MLQDEMPAIVSVAILVCVFVISFFQDMSHARRSRISSLSEGSSRLETASRTFERGLSRSVEAE